MKYEENEYHDNVSNPQTKQDLCKMLGEIDSPQYQSRAETVYALAKSELPYFNISLKLNRH